jgi:glycerol-3-phosphate dehydrogenase
VRREGVAPSAVSREHAIFVGPKGFITVVGGKLTTYRRMARQVVEEAALSAGLALKAANTAKRPLPGGRALPAQPSAAAGAIAERWDVDEEEADALYWLHGSSVAEVMEGATAVGRRRIAPGLPYLRASLRWAFASEMAQNLEDALVRRIPLAHRLPDAGAAVAEDAAQVVAKEADWDAAQRSAQVEAFLRWVGRENAWRRAL